MPGMVATSQVNECSGNSELTVLARPICLHCGYDLRGLQMPRACPECGRVNDPIADARRVREWFARRSTAIAWLFRWRRVPPGSWYLLFDAKSLRIARRREFVWLWLPAILAAVTVALGCWITIDYNVKVWYYDGADPEQRPRRVVHEDETDRLFATNMNIGWSLILLYYKPESWVQVVERHPKRVDISVPDRFDPWFFLWGCLPGLVVTLGYWPARAMAFYCARRAAGSRGQRELGLASRAAWTYMAAPLGIPVWLWFGASLLDSFGSLLVPERALEYLVDTMLLTAPGLWFLVSCMGYVLLTGLDRARLVFSIRLAECTAMTIASIGGLAATIWIAFEVIA